MSKIFKFRVGTFPPHLEDRTRLQNSTCIFIQDRNEIIIAVIGYYNNNIIIIFPLNSTPKKSSAKYLPICDVRDLRNDIDKGISLVLENHDGGVVTRKNFKRHHCGTK